VVPYEFVAHSYSSLTFSATLSQSSFEPGATAELSASLLEYDAVPLGPAKVWAEIRRPDGTTGVATLQSVPDDRYAAHSAMPIPGVYTFRIRARGETMHGLPFEREQTLTAVAVPGGDRWHPSDTPSNPLCELLDCLMHKGAMSDELVRKLKMLGIDPTVFLKCFEQKCRGVAGVIETRDVQPARISPSTATYSREQLMELITDIVNQSLKRLNR